MALFAGTTFSNSDPLGDPVIEKPNVYTVAESEMLVGVALANFAAPPDKESTKSSFSRFPLPLDVLKLASLRVTMIEALLAASNVLVILGPLLSFNFDVLLLCVVFAILPPAS